MTDANDAFRAARTQVSDRSPFLVAGDTTLSYGALDDRVARFATLLHERGVAPGAPVMVISHDAVAVAQLALGVIRSGRVLSVVDPCSSPREIRLALVAVEPALVIAAPAVIERCGLRDGAWQLIEIGATAPRTLAGRLLGRRSARTADTAATNWPDVVNAHEPAELPALDPDRIAIIVFTSGSTSRPKAVELSLGAILFHLATLRRELRLDGAVLHNVLPVSHVDGLIVGPLVTYLAGARLVRPTEFTVANIPDLLDAVYRHRVTHMFVVPTMLALYERLGSDMADAFEGDDFVAVVSSAGPLSAALWERFESRFGVTVCNSYGLSETVSGSLLSGIDGPSRRIGTVGKPIDCTVELLDADGRPVADGEVGEIVIAGDHLFSGYRHDPEATALALVDGRFATGDLAARDADGFFELRGRRSSMIVSGGRNISPLEVDAVVGGCPGVVEVATVGVEDIMWGQRVEAAVVAPGVTPQDIIAHCRNELSGYKVPQRIVAIEHMPLTSSGKIDTNKVRELLADRVPGRAGSVAIDDVVVAEAARVCGVAESSLSLSSTIDDVDGWDSLAHLELVGALEDHFGFEMSNADILGIRSLADVAEVVRTRAEAV